MRTVSLLVIHCSATPNGRSVTLEEIDAWHARRGFRRDSEALRAHRPDLKHIGYHFLIGVDGAVRYGRTEDEVGAHVAGFNQRSIGICLAGTDQFTPAQWASLKALLQVLLTRYPGARICGHRDLSPDQDRDGIIEPFEWLKICPGFDVGGWFTRGMLPMPGKII